MALEGDEWKNGDKPQATPQDMRRFHTLNSRVLLAITEYSGIFETYVMDVSPDGEYAKLAIGGDMFFGAQGKWIATSDCTVLSILCLRPQMEQSQAAWKKDTKLTNAALEKIWKEMNGDDTEKGEQDDNNDVG